MAEPDFGMFRHALPFFRALTDDDVAAVLKASRMQKLPERAVLAKEGEPAATAYMIIKGRVRLSRSQRHGIPTVMRDLYPGDVVGAVGLCDTGNYINSAEAVTGVTALAVDRDRFYALGAQGEPAVFRLIRALAPTIVESTRRSMAKVDALFDAPDEGIKMMERIVLASNKRPS